MSAQDYNILTYVFYNGPKDVANLQDFSSELNQRHNFKQYLRLAGLVLLLTQFIMYPMFWYYQYFLVPITNWTLMLTTASLCYSYWAAQCPEHFGPDALDKRKNPNWLKSLTYQARHHLLYTFSVFLNFMVTVVWWSLLHEHFTSKHRNHPVHGNGREIHLITIHVIPPAVCLLNTVMTNALVRFKIWKTSR